MPRSLGRLVVFAGVPLGLALPSTLAHAEDQEDAMARTISRKKGFMRATSPASAATGTSRFR
jgi:hypothetical protein